MLAICINNEYGYEKLLTLNQTYIIEESGIEGYVNVIKEDKTIKYVWIGRFEKIKEEVDKMDNQLMFKVGEEKFASLEEMIDHYENYELVEITTHEDLAHDVRVFIKSRKFK